MRPLGMVRLATLPVTACARAAGSVAGWAFDAVRGANPTQVRPATHSGRRPSGATAREWADQDEYLHDVAEEEYLEDMAYVGSDGAPGVGEDGVVAVPMGAEAGMLAELDDEGTEGAGDVEDAGHEQDVAPGPDYGDLSPAVAHAVRVLPHVSFSVRPDV